MKFPSLFHIIIIIILKVYLDEIDEIRCQKNFSELSIVNFVIAQSSERVVEKYVNAGIIPDLLLPGR